MVTDAVSHLAGTRYGPVTFATSDRGVVATFDGGTAEVSPDGATLVVESSASCRWPAVDDAATAERIHLALADLAAAREELCLVSADSATRTVRVTLWIDEASPRAAVASAARTTILLARVATAVMAGLTREIAAEQALVLAQDQAERVAAESERALATLMGRSAPATPQEPAPTAPHPVPVPVPAPAAAAPAAAPRPAGAPTAATGRPASTQHGTWCVADSAVAVRDLRSTTQISGSMQPGVTYEVRGDAHGWVHVAGHGIEGWVPASSVRRFTT